MITCRIDVPPDLGVQILKQLEKSLAAHLRKEGIDDVTVTIGEDGQASFSGPEESLAKVGAAMQRWP